MLQNLRFNMKRSRKTNRVSWAPASKLCQVKLFFSEDCPSKVGQNYKHPPLQAKKSSMLHSSIDECMDLPPGFEGGNRFLNQPKTEVTAHISRNKWKCPPRFAINENWSVAAGEASVEKKDQKLRELRVLEAVYPRLSAIPPSPSVSVNVQSEDYDDNLTPILPTEEEQDSMDINHPEVAAVTKLTDTTTTTHLQSQNLPQQHLSTKSLTSSQCITTSSAVPSSAVLGAASAVVATIMKSNNEQGSSLIDMDLLVKIFNDPIMIEKLIKEHTKGAATTPVSAPPSGKPAVSSVSSIPLGGRPVSGNSSTASVTLPKPTPHMQRPINKNIHHMLLQQDTPVSSSGVKRAAPFDPVSSTEILNTVPLPSTSSVNLHQTVGRHVQSSPCSVGSAFAVKDVDYYKNLIRQHGAARQEAQDSQVIVRHNNYFQNMKPVVVHNNIKQGEGMFKIQKPCLYFKSSKGCRNGSSCPYQHDDMSIQWGASNVLMGQHAKRMKLAPEIKGRT